MGVVGHLFQLFWSAVCHFPDKSRGISSRASM